MLSWKWVGDTGFPSSCAPIDNNLLVDKHDFIVILILTLRPRYYSAVCIEQASRRAVHSEGRVGASDHLDHGRSCKLSVRDTELLLWHPLRKLSVLQEKAADACLCTSGWTRCSWSQNFLHCLILAPCQCCSLSCGKSRTLATSSGWMRYRWRLSVATERWSLLGRSTFVTHLLRKWRTDFPDFAYFVLIKHSYTLKFYDVKCALIN